MGTLRESVYFKIQSVDGRGESPQSLPRTTFGRKHEWCGKWEEEKLKFLPTTWKDCFSITNSSTHALLTKVCAGILHKETGQRARKREQIVSKTFSAFSASVQKKSGYNGEPEKLASIPNLLPPNCTHHLISPIRHFFIYKRKRRRP